MVIDRSSKASWTHPGIRNEDVVPGPSPTSWGQDYAYCNHAPKTSLGGDHSLRLSCKLADDWMHLAQPMIGYNHTTLPAVIFGLFLIFSGRSLSSSANSVLTQQKSLNETNLYSMCWTDSRLSLVMMIVNEKSNT